MTSRRSEPLIPRFKITLELEPRAFDHADARRAAQRVADAIEQLMSDREGWGHLPLVQVKRMVVRVVPDGECVNPQGR